MDWGKERKFSVRIAGLRAKIWTWDLPIRSRIVNHSTTMLWWTQTMNLCQADSTSNELKIMTLIFNCNARGAIFIHCCMNYSELNSVFNIARNSNNYSCWGREWVGAIPPLPPSAFVACSGTALAYYMYICPSVRPSVDTLNLQNCLTPHGVY
jgi:hypothetical protein